ncbi:MAG: hypothetical protein NTV02_00385 [Candidatus Zambryskibacteria bacterium]|nr:hypothetical protein [Candidatus Zambryskibacteria bacterium]
MAFSFFRLAIYESDIPTYKEAIDYMEKNHMEINQRGTASCVGGDDAYRIWLGFSRIGVPSWKCSCVDDVREKNKNPCSYVLAASLVWDRLRGVPDPSDEDIEFSFKNTYN